MTGKEYADKEYKDLNEGLKGIIAKAFEAGQKDSEDYYDNREPMTERKLYQLWKDGVEFGYNKANEWHYVKDGDLPTHSYRVLVFTDEGVGFGIYGLDDKKWHTYDTGFDVIAWKEIVLPELPKESE